MDYAQFVDKGYGPAWRGVIFRRESKDLDDIVVKSTKWFSRMFPKARLMGGTARQRWVFEGGEQLLLRIGYMEKHYWSYHGHEYPWIGFDELTAWRSLSFYHMMKSCCRSSHPTVPRHFRASTNPYGPGHAEVKAYWIDPTKNEVPYTNPKGIIRMRVHGDLRQNPHLLKNDPDYMARLESDPNPERVKAWVGGDWNVVAGGYFANVWNQEKHILPSFTPPKSWTRFLSFDWGFSKPSSLGKWAVAPEDTVLNFRNRQVFIPKGSVIRYGELYTCERDKDTGVWRPNVGLRMENEALGAEIFKVTRDAKFISSVADPSIFVEDGGDSIYTQLRKGAKAEAKKIGKPNQGLPEFQTVDNSRIAGWTKMTTMLKQAGKPIAETPGMWVTESCVHFIRTVPVLQRSDKNPDDVDTDGEDHTGDESRYAIMRVSKGVTFTTTSGA